MQPKSSHLCSVIGTGGDASWPLLAAIAQVEQPERYLHHSRPRCSATRDRAPQVAVPAFHFILAVTSPCVVYCSVFSFNLSTSVPVNEITTFTHSSATLKRQDKEEIPPTIAVFFFQFSHNLTFYRSEAEALSTKCQSSFFSAPRQCSFLDWRNSDRTLHSRVRF